MELVGCGCMGFSFTQKYKNAIIHLFDSVSELGEEGVLEYQDFQERIASKGISDKSETRMIIPFLLKAKVINEENCIKASTGSRIRQLIINDCFFTDFGIEFVKILKLEFQKYTTNDKEVVNKINSLYHKVGLKLFINLCSSQDYIYKELFVYLKEFKSIDKNEFYLLTTSIETSKRDYLPVLIEKYRTNKIAELIITKNVNDWQYLTGT